MISPIRSDGNRGVKGNAAEAYSHPGAVTLGRRRRSAGLSQFFVERYRCLPDGESRNRVSMDRLQSGSLFMIPGRRGEKPERENAERKTK